MKIITVIFLTLLVVLSVLGQTQRNPVIEYCTGTWCVYCPDAKTIIENNILPVIPNTIIIAYHGPANGSDPFSFFYGKNQVLIWIT